MLNMQPQEVQGIGEVTPEPEDNDWQTAALYGELANVLHMQRIAILYQDVRVLHNRTKRF